MAPARRSRSAPRRGWRRTVRGAEGRARCATNYLSRPTPCPVTWQSVDAGPRRAARPLACRRAPAGGRRQRHGGHGRRRGAPGRPPPPRAWHRHRDVEKRPLAGLVDEDNRRRRRARRVAGDGAGIDATLGEPRKQEVAERIVADLPSDSIVEAQPGEPRGGAEGAAAPWREISSNRESGPIVGRSSTGRAILCKVHRD